MIALQRYGNYVANIIGNVTLFSVRLAAKPCRQHVALR